MLNPSIEPSYTPPVIIEVPCELPKVSLVNASLKKLKFHLTQFDSMVKKRNTPSALEKEEWGFEHTKAVFNNEIIPFLKSLKDIFNVFHKDLLNEITEVQTVFDQMEASVQQFLCELCKKCLNLNAELSKSKRAYNDLLKNYSQLEKHCISLEVSMQLKQEVFQNDESFDSQNAVAIPEYFEINDLKARLLDKDTTICKLKDTIKSLRKNTKEKNVNYDKCDFEPNNKDLENSVANLLSKNERKEIVENVIHIPFATTIAPGMFKIDLEPLPPRLLQNREELLVYVQDSCLNAITPNSRKVAVTPMNNAKKFRFTTTNVVRPKETITHSDEIQKPEIKVYSRKPKNVKNIGLSKIAKIVESKKANHSEPNQSWGSNATYIPSSSSLVVPGTVRFGNDQIARIMRYGEFQLGNVVILKKNTCFICNLEGVDLLSRSQDTNLYTFYLDDMIKSSLICLLSKASNTKSWLWHHWLSHFNFGFAVPVFSPGDNPIACLNKALAFLTSVASSRFPSTNNQLKTSSNQRNQATIQDGRVTVQQVQGKLEQNYSGHMARQCTQPKRPRNAAWYKEKAMLAEAQEAGQILDEEQLAFLADPRILADQAQTIIPHNAAFQTEDLDTYDSDCDDLSTAQAVLMANISNYGSDIILEVPNSETYLNDMDNQSVHALQDFEQTPVMDFTDNEISSDSNIIPYSQYLQETQQATVQDTNLQAQQDSMILSVIEQMSEQMINHVNNWEKANKEQKNESITAELERYKERVKTFEQRLNIDLSSREKMIDSQIREKLALKEQIDSLEQNLSKQIKEKESLFKTFTVFKNESKEKENKYLENEIDLEKKIKELDNIVYKVGQSAQTVHTVN
ncbi:hypothetical protein Tco_0002595 [Tanacetum coccineum]